MIIAARRLPLLGLLGAEFLSLLGNQVAAVAIPLLVLQVTDSPIATGIAGAGNVLPILFAAFIGGHVIDKVGAVRASLTADLMSCLSVLALPLVLIKAGVVSPLVLFFLVFLGALFDPTGIAARQTLVPSLTRLSGYPLARINGYRGALENGADLLGPLLGGSLIALLGALYTFYLNAASFLLCALLIALTIPQKKRTAPGHSKGDLATGIRFILANSNLKALALVGMAANFVVLPFLGLLLPVLTTQKFDSEVLLGVCLSVFGLAATGGALLFSWGARATTRSAIFYGGLLLTAAALVLCALVASTYGLVLSVALAGLILGASNPLEQTILQEEAPQKMAGQVFTTHTAIRFVAGPVGLLLAGFAVEYTSVETVLMVGGVFLFITAVAGWLRAPLSS